MRVGMSVSKIAGALIKKACCVWSFTLVALVAFSPALAQLDPETRPPTQDLLPETTVSFVQIDNFRDMVEKMQDASFYKMFEEESVASLRDGLWDEAKLAYEDVKEEVGLEVDDLMALPAGEMTFAVIAPRRKNPEFMLILELDDESEALDRVLDRGREIVQQESGEEITSEESEDGIKYESFNVEGKRVKFFRMGGLLVGSTSEDELDAFVDRWAGREVKKVRPLSANRKFITVMNRCLGSKELKPEARFFVDPISLAKSSTRGNVSAQVALNFLPALGLDGLLSIGGSMLLSEEDFESVVHLHVHLADPRTGIFEMIALKPTNYEPEPWLPADAVSYMTTSWDIDQMMTELTKMIEAFQGEGVVDEWIQENINDEIELDLKEDILAHLTGRVTYCQWNEPPMQLNSQMNVVAFEIENLEEFEKSIEAVIARVNRGDDDEEESEEAIEETDYNGVRIWSQPTKRIEQRMERRRERFKERRARRAKTTDDDDLEDDFSELAMENLKTPQPSFALIGNYLVFSPQSMGFIKHAIDTDQGDNDALVDDAEFQTISDKMTKLLKTDMPCAMMYSNPEETFRMLFELYNSESTQGMITRGAEKNKYLAGVHGRLKENPLPEFDDLKKYFKPAGGYALSDETGYHFLLFALRGDREEKDE